MTDTLEPPVETQVQADPAKITAPSGGSGSMADRMREIREKSPPMDERGGIKDQPQQRVERRKEAPKPIAEVAKPEVVAEPEKKETSPFDILNDLQTKGLEEKSDAPPAPPGSTPKAIATWKQMNDELAQAKKELEMAKQVGTPEDIKAAKAELEASKTEIAAALKKAQEAEDKLAQRDVRESKKYKETVEIPNNKILEELGLVSKHFNIPWRNIVDVIEASDKVSRNAALSKVMAEGHVKPADPNDESTPMDEVSRLEMVSSINEYLQRDAYGRELESKAGEVSEALKRESETAEKEKHAQTETQFKKTADMVFEKMAEAIPQLKNDPEFAKKVRESVSLKEQPLHIRAMKDIYMASAERVLKDHQAQHQKDSATIKSLEDRIAQLTGASPEVGTGEPEKSDTEKALDDKRPLSERIAAIRKG